MDIGNSTVEYASYTDRIIGDTTRIETAKLASHIASLMVLSYEKVIISSVVPEIDLLFKAYSHVQFISHTTLPGLRLNVPNPEQVGADRLVNALSAWIQLRCSCLIVDSGTATTFCYVDATGTYQGGSIFPGMGIASKALNQYTAKIPLIHVSPCDSFFGKTTQTAVESGLYWGFIHMINGMIASYKQLDPGIKIVGTGQGLTALKDQLNLDVFDPHLILKGLAFCADVA